MGKKKNNTGGNKQDTVEEMFASGASRQDVKDYLRESGGKITDRERQMMNNAYNSMETKTTTTTKTINGQDAEVTRTITTCGNAKVVHKSEVISVNNSQLYWDYQKNITKTSFGDVLTSRQVEVYSLLARNNGNGLWNAEEYSLNTSYNYDMYSNMISGSYNSIRNNWSSQSSYDGFYEEAEKLNYRSSGNSFSFTGEVNRDGKFGITSIENSLDKADMRVEQMLEAVLTKKLFNNTFTVKDNNVYLNNTKSTNLKSNTNKSLDKDIKTNVNKKGNHKSTKINGVVLENPPGYRRSQGYTTFVRDGKTYAVALFNPTDSSNESKSGKLKICIYEISADGRTSTMVSSKEIKGLGHGNTLSYLGEFNGEQKFITKAFHELVVISYDPETGISKKPERYQLPKNVKNVSEIYYDSNSKELYMKSDNRLVIYDVNLDKKGNISFKKDSSGREMNFYQHNKMSEALSQYIGENVDETRIYKNSGAGDGKYYYQGITIKDKGNYVLTYDLKTQELIKVTEVSVPPDVAPVGIEIEDINIDESGNMSANVLLLRNKNKYNYWETTTYLLSLDKKNFLK